MGGLRSLGITGGQVSALKHFAVFTEADSEQDFPLKPHVVLHWFTGDLTSIKNNHKYHWQECAMINDSLVRHYKWRQIYISSARVKSCQLTATIPRDNPEPMYSHLNCYRLCI